MNTTNQIKEGSLVVHNDQHGESGGIADSDAMPSGNRIKVSFTSGIRKGECRWIPLDQVSHANLASEPCPDCPDGYVWTVNGQTDKECPTCKGEARLR